MVDTLFEGGWVMAAIGLCSVAAVAVVLERLIALRHNRVIAPSVSRAVEIYEEGNGGEQSLLMLCAAHPSAFSRIIAAVVKMTHLDHAERLEGMRAAGRIEMDRLDRGLAVLEIVAGAAPLLGLLGTVLGMMDVFSVISAEGLGDAQALSEGISKALITTVAGLCVAIPTLAFHGMLLRKVNTMASEMQDRVTRFVLHLPCAPQPDRDTEI